MNRIIVEGPDCAGKSMLVERLKNELHWDAKSLHHRNGAQFSRYLREYAMQECVIFDRGHISEAVYGRLWRGGSPFEPWQQEILDSLVKNTMVSIFALPDPRVLHERYQERTYPQQIQLHELETAAGHFAAYAEMLRPTFIYRSSGFAELSQLIEDVRGAL